MNDSVRTPAKEDKRLWFTVGVIAALLALAIAGVVNGDEAAKATVALAGLYMVQSQAGVVLRSRAKARREEPEEAE